MLTANLALLACASLIRGADDSGVIRVTAQYPGATARVVDSAVTLPLLQLIDGVRGATRIEAESNDDGTCTITIRLDAKADPVKSRDFVRQRVALAKPRIPPLCQREGITVRTAPAQPVEFWFALTSSAPGDDAKSLANSAGLKYADVLRRVPGVREVRLRGTADLQLRVMLDPAKLRALDLSVEEVHTTVRAMNGVITIRATDPLPKGGFPLVVRYSGGNSTFANALYKLVIKTGAKGEKVLLRDVGRMAVGSAVPNELTTFDGKPAALIAVTATCDVSLKQIEKACAPLREALPPGRQLTTVITPTAPRVLCLEMVVPDGTTMEYTLTQCERVMKTARAWNGGLPAIGFTDRLQTNQAALLVTCKANADAAVLRKRLAAEVRQATIRISDVTGGKPAFPVRLALVGPAPDKLRKWAEVIRAQATETGIVDDVVNWPNRDVTSHELIIDNDKAIKMGVSVSRAVDVLGVLTGNKNIQQLDLDDVFVKNAKGEMVAFSAFATVNSTLHSASIYRLGLERAVRITANAAGGKSVAACAEKLRDLAEGEKTKLKLPTGYRAVVLTP